MVASMQLAGYELLHNPGISGGYAPSNGNPMYALLDGWDLGAPVPRVAQVASQYIDGSRQYGRRSDNRAFKLPIAVAVTVADGRTALAAAIENLLLAVDQPTYQLLWTPDGGLQNRFDLFRASISHEYQLTLEQAATAFGQPCLARAFTLTAEALPYAAEVSASSITLPTPYATLGTAPVRASAYLLDRTNTGYPGNAPTPLLGSFVMPSTGLPTYGGNLLIHHAPIEGGGPAAVPMVVPMVNSGGGDGKIRYQGNTAPVSYGGTYEVLLAVPSAGIADANIATYSIQAVINFQSSSFSAQVASAVVSNLAFNSQQASPLGEFVSLGYVTLPAIDWPADRAATDASYYVSVNVNVNTTSTGSPAAITWTPDVLLLDTRGQTLIFMPNFNVPITGTYWIEEPVIPFETQGKLLRAPAATPTHPKSSGMVGNAYYLAGGAPLQLDPDPRGNTLLIYCSSGMPGMALTRRDRWLSERTL